MKNNDQILITNCHFERNGMSNAHLVERAVSEKAVKECN